MPELAISCALTERIFHLHWPEGIRPDNWSRLGELIEDELGGIFSSFPEERSSRYSITSGKSDNALVDSLSEIIRTELPEGTDARIVFWGTVDQDTKWKEEL